MKKFHQSQSGQIIILALIIALVFVAVISGLVSYSSIQSTSHKSAVAREQAVGIAEAGIEKAIWKLNNVANYTGESDTAFGQGTYTITITNLSGSSKLIKADAYIPNAASPRIKRTIQVTATIGTINVGFNYGVQVGNGGLSMSNSSRVVGNVYSDGNITGSNSATIEGTAIATGTRTISGMDVTGNAQAYTINGSSNIDGNATVSSLASSTVDGNVVADSISSCTIGGTAIYDSRSSCTISGATTTPNPNAYSQAPTVPFPISDAQMDAWEAEATAGGVLSTQTFNSGTRTMGPVKINGDLNLSNTAELVITGTIWVTGNITFSNSSILRLSSGFGASSGVVMAGVDESASNGVISINNSTQVLGSGTAGSYVLLLSQKEGTGSVAINQSNGGGVSILYAAEGRIDIANSSQMKEITAALLSISNSATVSYESGLANANFSSGPGGGYEIVDQSWQLIQ